MNFLSILLLIFSPAIAALFVLSPFFPNNEIKIRRFAKGFATTHFIYSLLFLLFFNPTNFGWSYQKELTFFKMSWGKTLGLSATFGVDGVSLICVLLTSFLVLLAIIVSKSMIRTKHRIYYPLVLILETALLGLFCAKDIFLFLLFWELELIPMYFLISQWGDKPSSGAATKYVVYSFVGTIFMFLGLLVLYFYSFSTSGVLTADIESLSMSENVFALWFQGFIFFCLLFGFAIKLPIVPFHTLIPSAQVESVTPVSTLLAGVIPVAGCYGIIRFNLGLFPEVFGRFAPILIALGILNIIYGACLALVQIDIKRIVVYAGISQVGFVLLALGSLTEIGFSAAVYQMIIGGIILSGLFMLTGIIYLRTKTREIYALGGLSQVMPICMYLGLIIILGAMGAPLTAGFAAKFMSVTALSLSDLNPQIFIVSMAVLAGFGIILNAGAIMRFFHKIFFGSVLAQFKSDTLQYDEAGNEITVVAPKRGITKSEIIVLTFIAVAIIFFGVYPSALLDIFQVTSDVILDFIKV